MSVCPIIYHACWISYNSIRSKLKCKTTHNGDIGRMIPTKDKKEEKIIKKKAKFVTLGEMGWSATTQRVKCHGH